MASTDSNMISHGRNIVMYGKTKGTSFVSKYFVCTSCHNTVREDADLSVVDQDGRLRYAESAGISYLQGSTFFGMVNRESWYNDDYVKKYGELVVKANKSLEESIQLCASVCSSGRGLGSWEMDAVKSYLWTLQYRLGDLDLDEGEWTLLRNALADKDLAQEAITMLKSNYMVKSPATFADAPADRMKGYEIKGRPEMGAIIFKRACRHCHRPDGESDVIFSETGTTFRWLKRHITWDSHLSIYHAARYGTSPEAGHMEYMPLFTLEKMSHQQVEDLRAYIEKRASQ